MKRFICMVLGLMVFLAPFGSEAAISVTELGKKEVKDVALFDVSMKEVNKIQGTNTLEFKFQTTDIDSRAGIDHWKMRVWCDVQVQVALTRTGSQCGQAITLSPLQVKEFLLYATKVKGQKTNFSFKLKAYDKTGKWLHSEEERFQW